MISRKKNPGKISEKTQHLILIKFFQKINRQTRLSRTHTHTKKQETF